MIWLWVFRLLVPVQAGSVQYQGALPDTLRVKVGDTVTVRFVMPNRPGRYWLHVHGPQYIYQLPAKSVVILSPP